MDAHTKDVLCVLLKSDKVEQSPAGLDLHEQVDVAIEGIISPSNGAEYAKISHAVLFCRLFKGDSEPANLREA